MKKGLRAKFKKLSDTGELCEQGQKKSTVGFNVAVTLTLGMQGDLKNGEVWLNTSAEMVKKMYDDCVWDQLDEAAEKLGLRLVPSTASHPDGMEE